MKERSRCAVSVWKQSAGRLSRNGYRRSTTIVYFSVPRCISNITKPGWLLWEYTCVSPTTSIQTFNETWLNLLSVIVIINTRARRVATAVVLFLRLYTTTDLYKNLHVASHICTVLVLFSKATRLHVVNWYNLLLPWVVHLLQENFVIGY